MPLKSSGILFFKKENEKLKIFLVHPGGPFWSKKDLGAWSIPKGLVEENEDLKLTAIREITEELGIDLSIDTDKLVDLGTVRMKNGKTIYGFGYEADFGDIEVKSNKTTIEWPPKSGKELEISEIDKGEWYDLNTAQIKINPAQKEFVLTLESLKH